MNSQITRLEEAIAQISHLEKLTAEISDRQATLVNKMAAKPDCYENKDEDLKVIDVSPIKSLFCNMNLDNYGTEYDPPLPRRRSKNYESFDLDAKFDKSGIEEIKTLDVAKPTIMDFKEFNYENCSLIDCISLLQSVLKSPHAYSQIKRLLNISLMPLYNLMKKNLNWKFLSIENFMMSGNQLLKLKLKIMSFMHCVIWVLVSLLFPKLCVIC